MNKVNKFVGNKDNSKKEIEGEVKPFSYTSAHIILPKAWIGKTVRVEIKEPNPNIRITMDRR